MFFTLQTFFSAEKIVHAQAQKKRFRKRIAHLKSYIKNNVILLELLREAHLAM